MFPTDIYVDIFEGLDYQSLLKCMQVCSLFRELINDTASLQYIIELAASGQTNGPGAIGSTSASRLENLKKHQSSWASSKWSRELRIPMLTSSSRLIYAGILGQCTREGKLTLNQLPSDLRSIKEEVWTLDLGFYPAEFIMDPSQDLLVLTERPDWNVPEEVLRHSIHLRSLSDGKPHPLAHIPILFRLKGNRRNIMSYTNQVSGTFLASHFWSDDSDDCEIVIWNWMTGELQANVYGPNLQSFSFLSDTHVILATLDEAQCPQLVVMDFQKESSKPHHLSDLQNAITFCYPELHTGRIAHLDIHVDPWRLNPRLQVPFFRDTGHVLFTLSLWVDVDDHIQPMVQFLPSSSLTTLIKNKIAPFQCYKWDEWGPHGSRLFSPRSDTRHRLVHGWKYVSLEDDVSQGRVVVRLYDFNQMAIKRNYRDTMDKGSCADDDRWVYQRAGTSVIPGVFKDPVETTLPYRSQVLSLQDVRGWKTFLCTEDHVIIRNTNRHEYRILIF